MKKIILAAFAATSICLVANATGAHGKVQLWEGGPYWAETNIGADEPWDYGLYFWWGDTVGYSRIGGKWVASDGSASDYSFDRSNTTWNKSLSQLQEEGYVTEDGILAPEHDAAKVKWGGAWRMPTKEEIDALVRNCEFESVTTNGITGYLVRGKGDFASASIFLPAAGYVANKNLTGTEVSACYLSTKFYSKTIPYYLGWTGRNPQPTTSTSGPACNGYGSSIRPVYEEPKLRVTECGAVVEPVVRGEDGRTLSFGVAAGTEAGDITLEIGGVDVTKGFRVTVDGAEAQAVLLAPFEVPKEEGAPDAMWTENGDGTVTLNVTVVPGLYYASASAAALDALACPGADTPATDGTTLTAPKPAGGNTGFFKVWVSDAPIPAAP